MSKPESSGGSVSAGVLLALVGLVLIFGVTINGHHYGVKSCDMKQGVIIDAPEK